MDLLPIINASISADVQPVSRFAGGDDSAIVTTTLLVESVVTAEQITAAFPSATVHGRVASIVDTVEVPEVSQSEDETVSGVFRLSLHAPPQGTELRPSGDITVTVLLPHDAVYTEDPVYQVALRSATRTPEPVIFGVGALPPLAGRIAVTWYKRGDPEVLVEYIYEVIRGRP